MNIRTSLSQKKHPALKRKFLNITKQFNDNNKTLEYHERYQSDQGSRNPYALHLHKIFIRISLLTEL